MKLRVAITDNDWFRFLRSQPELVEINFWQPRGGRGFRALDPGELLLFKLHSPENYIVGGGVFTYFWKNIPTSLAWETFGAANGAASLADLRGQIGKRLHAKLGSHDDPMVGCLILSQPFFFPDHDWIPSPVELKQHIQQGKNYDATEGTGLSLWLGVQQRLGKHTVLDLLEPQPSLYGEPRLIRPRLGQGGFRGLVTDVYARRCAMTNERALPVLEAAHIQPVAEGGQHRIDNGLLLRSDLHRLFDRGYVTVTPDGRVRVSRRLKDEFDNGEIYYPLEGREIWRPSGAAERPRPEFLEWHADTVFRG